MTRIHQDYPEYADVDPFVVAQRPVLSVLRDRCAFCGGFGCTDYNNKDQRCHVCHGSGWVEYTQPPREP